MSDIDPELKKRIVAEHGVDRYSDLPQPVKNNIEAGSQAEIDPYSILRGGGTDEA